MWTDNFSGNVAAEESWRGSLDLMEWDQGRAGNSVTGKNSLWEAGDGSAAHTRIALSLSPGYITIYVHLKELEPHIKIERKDITEVPSRIRPQQTISPFVE